MTTGRGPYIDPDSKASKIAAFFEANPNEWLTWEDFMTKFDIDTRKKAHSLVGYLRDRRGVNLHVQSVISLQPGAVE
jgi:hypothetical protein